jgi:hypothetical protein
VDGINHKDTVKIYSERIEAEYGLDDAEEGEEDAEGYDAEAEEGEVAEEDEQTDQ